jgi:N-acetylneuraminic acid mutarotase
MSIGLIAASLLFGATILPASPCPGDCDGDGAASAVEISLALALVFDADGIEACPAADVDDSGAVTAADVVAILAARGTLPEVCAEPFPRWMDRAPLAGGPRQEVGAAALGQSMYVIGGFDGLRRGTEVVERYDVGDDRWTRVADLPRALQHVGAASLDGAVYSVGGYIGSTFVPTDQVFRYDPDLDAWTEVGSLPFAVGALAAVALDGRLHAIGGGTTSGSVALHWVYDPASNEWSAASPFPGNGRDHLAAVALAGSIYLVGGRPGAATRNSNGLDRWDPETDTWTPLAPVPTARSGHAVAALGGRIYALGGEVSSVDPDGVFPQVEVYDPATDVWTSLPDMPVPRHGLGAVAIGLRLYLPGGATVAGFGATAHHDALEP